MTRRNQINYLSLRDIFLNMEQVLVAFSGGVDSALLLKIGTDTLGADCTGVLGISPSLAGDEKNQAIKIAAEINAVLEIVYTQEMDNPLYLQNDQSRCFHCKNELYSILRQLAKKKKIKFIADGTNADDMNDFRPGMQAAHEHQIRSPLMEAGLGKNDIRELARFLDIPVWDKPAQPCLASRIMYGHSIDPIVLDRIDRAEKFIRNRGYKVVRVRSMGSYASVEIGEQELSRVLQKEESHVIVRKLSDLGFQKVCIDPEGYRQGKLNTKLAAG